MCACVRALMRTQCRMNTYISFGMCVDGAFPTSCLYHLSVQLSRAQFVSFLVHAVTLHIEILEHYSLK